MKYLFLFLIVIFTFSCIREKDPQILQRQDTALIPNGLPLAARQKEQAKKNLISNPSFESGKFYIDDTLKLSFSLPGWKKVGEHVYWTNIEDRVNYSEKDASNGIHAIKISRRTVNETDNQGEGIITDYIRVIPGNYNLMMDVRLENVSSNLDRFGTGIYDAINLRIYYYDKNRVLIRKTDFHPGVNRQLDPGFKGYNFSHNQEIPEFDWARITARTANFPYDEGNIPENTRYVKIFAGLKGSGDMWIDYVNFNYSDKNFTFLEQLRPYFDSAVDLSAYLLPTPHEIDNYIEIPLKYVAESNSEVMPLFVYPRNTGSGEKQLILELERYLIRNKIISSRSNSFITRIQQNRFSGSSLIVSIGKTDLYRQFSETLPEFKPGEKGQQYFIRRIKNNNEYIFIDYSDTEGLARALHTFRQLVDTEKGIYHHYDISDYPDYTARTVIIPESALTGDDFTRKATAELVNYGMNRTVLEIPLADYTGTAYARLGNTWETALTAWNKHNPSLSNGFYFSSFPLKNTSLLMTAGEEYSGEELLKSVLDDAGTVSGILKDKRSFIPDFYIFSDESIWDLHNGDQETDLHVPVFTMTADADKEFFKALNGNGSIQPGSQVYLKPLIIKNSDQKRNRAYADLYYDYMSDPAAGFSGILWQGPVDYPEIVDHSDIYNFAGKVLPLNFYTTRFSTRKESYITGSYYSLYSWRAITSNLFDGMDMLMEGIIPEDFSGQVIVDFNPVSELNLVRIISLSDYLWNTSDYDPALSAWKVLRSLYGEKTAGDLVYFSDAYYKLLATLIEIETRGYNARLDKDGENAILIMDRHWEEIKVSLASHLSLLNELTDLKNSLISRFYQARRGNNHITEK